MAIIPVSLDYSNRDFDSLTLRLQGLVQSVFPTWTDYNVATFGNILLELFSYVGDTLHYYQDAQANEAFWPTLTQRISAIRMAQLFGYQLRGASAATVDLTFTIPAVYTSNLTIAAGTRVRTTDPENYMYFRTTVAGSILIGNVTTTIAAEQAETRSDEFDSDDEPEQELVLNYSPFIDDSLDSVTWDGTTLLAGLTAANGDYAKATNNSFLGYGPTDRIFVIIVDHLDRAHVRFGNGVNGEIPQGEIRAAYKVGGGVLGNADAGRVTILDEPMAFDDAVPAIVSVTNALAAAGGVDRMSLAEARAEVPASLRVLTRTVTREDFETVARSVPGVARALMATANEYGGITENTGRLYIVAQGTKLASGRIQPATPSSALLAAVTAEIDNNKPPMITFSYEAFAAVFKSIPVSTRVYLHQGAVGATVHAAIVDAIKDFFAAQLSDGLNNTDIDFGANLLDVEGAIIGELVWSDVFDVVKNVSGVRKVDEGVQGLLLDNQRSSVTLLPVEFPQVSTIIVVNADTGVTL